jgi:hypothetical protein
MRMTLMGTTSCLNKLHLRSCSIVIADTVFCESLGLAAKGSSELRGFFIVHGGEFLGYGRDLLS